MGHVEEAAKRTILAAAARRRAGARKTGEGAKALAKIEGTRVTAQTRAPKRATVGRGRRRTTTRTTTRRGGRR